MFSSSFIAFIPIGVAALPSPSAFAAFQHHSFYPFRAVETGRTIVRSANIGPSSVILPNGSVRVRTGIFKTAALSEKVPIYTLDTIYLKYGNWFLYVIISILTSIFLYVKLRKNEDKKLPN